AQAPLNEPAAAPAPAAPAPAAPAASPAPAPAAAPAAVAPATAPAAPVVPADYDLSEAEGVLDATSIAEVKAGLKAAEATQEQAAAHVKGLVTAVQTINQRASQAAATRAAEALKADPEFGGANFEKTLADAKATVITLAGEEALKELDETGLGNSPALIRMLAK